MTNPIDITPAGIAKALEGVTRGPWKVQSEYDVWCMDEDDHRPNAPLFRPDRTYRRWGLVIHDDTHEKNAQFIAYARNALPLIAARIAELEAERDAAYAEGYRAGVMAAADKATTSVQMLRNTGMAEGAEVLVAAAEDIRALLNSEAKP